MSLPRSSSLYRFLREDAVPIPRHRYRELGTILTDDVLLIVFEAWISRMERRVQAERNGHDAVRTYAGSPTLPIPVELQRRHARVRQRLPAAYQHEQMGELVAEIRDVVARGGGRRDVVELLRGAQR